MDKYINLNDLITQLANCENQKFLPTSCSMIKFIENFPTVDIDNIPTADVVEVVRCRECIHWFDKWEAVSIPEAHYCRKMGLFKLSDYYCADGKRKDGGPDE